MNDEKLHLSIQENKNDGVIHAIAIAVLKNVCDMIILHFSARPKPRTSRRKVTICFFTQTLFWSTGCARPQPCRRVWAMRGGILFLASKKGPHAGGSHAINKLSPSPFPTSNSFSTFRTQIPTGCGSGRSISRENNFSIFEKGRPSTGKKQK